MGITDMIVNGFSLAATGTAIVAGCYLSGTGMENWLDEQFQMTQPYNHQVESEYQQPIYPQQP